MTDKSNLVSILIMVIATFLMGSSFVVGKMGLAYYSPLILSAYRFLVAGGLLLIMVICFQTVRPKKSFIWKSAVIGSLQTAGLMACIFISLQYINAGESSILTFTNPLFVLILSSLFFKERHTVRQWFGVFVGIIGISIVISGNMSLNQGTFIGLLGALFWAAATLMYKRWQDLHTNAWLLTGIQMLFGGLILLILALLTGDTSQIWNRQSLSILLWLAIPGSILQFGLWYVLLARMNPARASSFLFLAPVFGVLTGAWWLNEPLHPIVLLGGTCVFISIYLSSKKPD
jgi:probable blue pigment (indigoidine) exporter